MILEEPHTIMMAGIGMRGEKKRERRAEEKQVSPTIAMSMMKSFQVKGEGKGTEELNQLYMNLLQDWYQFEKQSNSATAPRKYPNNPILPSDQPIQLLENSPRNLMFALQQESQEEASCENNNVMMRTKDLAAQEILRDRRDAIESGKLKGRRLFQSMDGEIDKLEVRSLSFGCSEDDEHSSGSKLGLLDYNAECFNSSSSSSSSPCLLGASVVMKKDQEMRRVPANIVVAETIVGGGRPAGNGTRYGVVFRGFIAIVLLTIAVCMRLARSSGRHEATLVPT